MDGRSAAALVTLLASVGTVQAQVDLSRRVEQLEQAGRYEAAATLLSDAGEWEEAARIWRLAVERDERMSLGAVQVLEPVPPGRRDAVLRAVFRGREWHPVVNRFAAELLLTWGRPDEAWPMLDASLPADPSDAYQVLRRFADKSGRLGTPLALRARGYALERMAEVSGDREAVRLRLEAAQAFAEAGELASAQRLLQGLPSDRAGGSPDDARALAALIDVLAGSGRVTEAERQLDEWADRMGPDLTQRLTVRIAEAWLRGSGIQLDRAESILGGDSTVGARGIRGWIALYRGELRRASEHFRAAGPYASSREEATRRARMLVLLDRVGLERSEGMGNALLCLARGDTLGAVTRLENEARRALPGGARQALLLFAGELAMEGGAYDRAFAVLSSAAAADSAGPLAPAALLALARAYVAIGRGDDAVMILEHLIISYPESALVPGARRMLDGLRGAVPRT